MIPSSKQQTYRRQTTELYDFLVQCAKLEFNALWEVKKAIDKGLIQSNE